MPLQIINLQPDQWPILKNLRLQSLSESGENFGSSFENEEQSPDEYWQSELENPNKKYFFAKINGEVVGMLCLNLNSLSKTQHKAKITQVFLQEQWRSRGIFPELMNEVLRFANNIHLVKVTLTVLAQNEKAIKAYEKHGFVVMGKMQKELFVNNKFYDEVYMEKLI
jgi:RimJ/RimL family protein N-acetyltransferase